MAQMPRGLWHQSLFGPPSSLSLVLFVHVFRHSVPSFAVGGHRYGQFGHQPPAAAATLAEIALRLGFGSPDQTKRPKTRCSASMSLDVWMKFS